VDELPLPRAEAAAVGVEARPLTSFQTSVPETFNLTSVVEQTEKDLILRVLSATGGAQAEAARRMGLSRSALAYKLNKYGIRAAD